MAVPDYFGRNAVAAAQAISGLDQERLATSLDNVRIGITIGHDAQTRQAQALTDLLVRLLARLYPTLILRGDSNDGLAYARELALRINPRIDLGGSPTVEIVVGSSKLQPATPTRIFVGCDGWTASISTSRPQACEDTDSPFGAGVAACLAAGNLFRHLFLPQSHLDSDATFQIFQGDELRATRARLQGSLGDLVLAGAGAIGNAAAWALSRVPMNGTLAIVDYEVVDLGNLQRYVLAEREDEGVSKPAVAVRFFRGPLKATRHEIDLARFVEAGGHRIDRLLLALDSARDRRVGQASLPRWIVNAWTQPGDLGVSTHDFPNGACVNCLYLPDRALMNEDAMIAQAFGVPDRIMQIRHLLYQQQGVPRDLLQAIAAAREVSLERLLPFEGRPVRTLYTDGFCGGAVIPLSQIGAPAADTHVPLAHQSALAGVLLAAYAVADALGEPARSRITQIDVLKPLQRVHTRLAAKDPRGICICQDTDYRDVYEKKFAPFRS